MAKWIIYLGGRRFLLALGAGIACTILVWFGKITAEVFRDTVAITVAVYIGGNSYQKVKEKAINASQDN